MADLQSILSDFVRRAGLPNVSLDVSDISGLVGGLALSGRNEVRAAVEAITQIFQIDTLERGGTLAFRQRGKASVATITEGIAAGVTAAAEPHRFFLLQLHREGDAAGAEVGAIAKPAVLRATAGAEVVHPRRQHQGLRTGLRSSPRACFRTARRHRGVHS